MLDVLGVFGVFGFGGEGGRGGARWIFAVEDVSGSSPELREGGGMRD